MRLLKTGSRAADGPGRESGRAGRPSLPLQGRSQPDFIVHVQSSRRTSSRGMRRFASLRTVGCYYGGMEKNNLESDSLTDNLICMETTLTAFQRGFAAARKAADRGETVAIKADDSSEYVFYRRAKAPARPFEDLEGFFGVVSLNRKSEPARDRIRRHIRKNAAA